MTDRRRAHPITFQFCFNRPWHARLLLVSIKIETWIILLLSSERAGPRVNLPDMIYRGISAYNFKHTVCESCSVLLRISLKKILLKQKLFWWYYEAMQNLYLLLWSLLLKATIGKDNTYKYSCFICSSVHRCTLLLNLIMPTDPFITCLWGFRVWRFGKIWIK